MKLNCIVLLKFILIAFICVPIIGECQNNDIDSFLQNQPKVFNINNVPINISFLKDSSKYVGFIIAGHAEKAVCQIASLEVENKLEKLGLTDSTIFSYGVAYDIRTKNLPKSYDSLLNTMKKKFTALQKNNPYQVRIFETSIDKYIEALNLIKRNFTTIKEHLNDSSLKYNQFSIEYKDIGFPLVVPFYNSDSIITFKIKKNVVGEIPINIFNKSVVNEINRQLLDLNKYINLNNTTISQLQKASNNTTAYVFKYYYVNKGNVTLVSDNLGGYPSPPDDFVIETINQKGQVISTRPINFTEAVAQLNNPNTQIDPLDRKLLRAWVERVRQYSRSFSQNKSQLRQNLLNANATLIAERNTLKLYKNSISNLIKKDDQNLTIDAFLRGWTFNTYDSVLNNELDNWYETKRKLVWSSVLNNQQDFINTLNPILKGKETLNIAGIFQSENVFFDVKVDQDYYIIRPYQMLGGSFIQVINRKSPTAEFYTLNNFRTIQK